MTPRERWLKVMRGEAVDRVPLLLEGFHFESVGEVDDPTKLEIVERIHDEVHFNHNCETYINRYLVTPPQRIREVDHDEMDGDVTITSEIDTPKGKLTAVIGRNSTSRTTWTLKYPCESLEDIEKIRSVPWELPPELAPPDTKNLPSEFDRRGIHFAGVSSPFVCMAGMLPYEYFLELCATERGLMKELTEQCLERILSVMDVILSEKTVDYVWVGGSEWVTPPMGSPEVYEELVQEYERKVIDRAHEAGAVVHVHCHGNVRSTLEMVIERGGDFFEPVEPPPDGDITFAEAKTIANGRITLGGNVEARILENENADAVEEVTRRAFEGGKTRMVLQNSAGPIRPLDARMLENHHRMIDAWEELSAI